MTFSLANKNARTVWRCQSQKAIANTEVVSLAPQMLNSDWSVEIKASKSGSVWQQ